MEKARRTGVIRWAREGFTHGNYTKVISKPDRASSATRNVARAHCAPPLRGRP
jgi:hypothetical protein